VVSAPLLDCGSGRERQDDRDNRASSPVVTALDAAQRPGRTLSAYFLLKFPQ
jgi:hypothetical protein